MASGFDPAALDRWLTTDPREQDAADFEAWCEENDIDGSADGAWQRFEQWREDEYDAWVPEAPEVWDTDPPREY